MRYLCLPLTQEMTQDEYKKKFMEEIKEVLIELEKGNDIKALASEFFDVAQSGANYLESLGLNINIENQTHINKLEDRGIVR